MARKFNKAEEENQFGIQIDSIIDVINFGVTPIVIAVSIGMNEAIDIVLFLLYIFAVTMRLAYFNMSVLKKSDNKPIKYYTGLPVTYVSSILPAGIWLMFLAFNKSLLVLRLVFGLLTLFYVLKIKIPKPRGKAYHVISLVAISLVVLIILFI